MLLCESVDSTTLVALVANADPATSRAFAEVLTQLGFHAVTTTSGEEALERFHTASPSLILLDLDIADIPARQLLRHFRSHVSHAPVIALSRTVDVATVAEVVRAGATEVFRKSSSRENCRLMVDLKDELRSRTNHSNANGRMKVPLLSGLGLREIGRRAAQAAEQAALREALERVGGNRAAAARVLKISHKTLRQKLNEGKFGRRPGARDRYPEKDNRSGDIPSGEALD